MWRLYKATDEGRGWAEGEEQADSGRERERKREREREKERERVSGARLVCQSPSIPPTMQPYKQTLTDSHHTHTHTHTHVPFMRMFPRPLLSPRFEALKCGCQKGSVADSLPASPPGGRGGTDRLIVRGGSSDNKGDQKSRKSDRHTWRVQTPPTHLHCLANTGTRFSEAAWMSQILPRTSGWRQRESGWVSGVCEAPLAPVHTDRQLYVNPIKEPVCGTFHISIMQISKRKLCLFKVWRVKIPMCLMLQKTKQLFIQQI